MAKDQPSQYSSIAVDGAYQGKFTIPRFGTSTKEQSWHGILIHRIDTIEYGPTRHLRLYTMPNKLMNGANSIVEAIHRLINNKANLHKLSI